MNNDNNLHKLESNLKTRDEPTITELKSKKSQWWRISAIQENKILRCTSLGLIFCILILIIGYHLQRNGSRFGHISGGDDEYCSTQGCVIASANVMDRLDPHVDPCDDFYDFACGNFVRRVVLPDDKSFITSISTTNDVLSLKLRMLVQEERNETDPQSEKLVKNLFKSCMNLDLIEKKGMTPLKDYMAILGGWPVVEGNSWNGDNFSLPETLYKMRDMGFSASNLFSFRVTTDMKNTSWRVLEFEQAKLGMPSREYFMGGFETEEVQAYLDFQVTLATLLGADPELAKKELAENVKFEIQIANMTTPDEERRDINKLYNKMTLKELALKVPDIPWVELTNAYLHGNFNITEDEPIVVTVPEFIVNLFQLLMKSSKRTIANYLLWHIVSISSSYLSKEVRNVEMQYSKKLFGVDKEAPRWKDCMDLVANELPFAVGALYVRNFFNEQSKSEAEEMVTYIRKTFDDNLETLDWMDEVTKRKAIKKAKAIKSFIGYPKEILDEELLVEHYKGLEINDGELLPNMARVSQHEKNRINSRLREKVTKSDWKIYAAAAVVNAFYSSVDNAILFPAGILQGVFFDAERPKYMNYGAIGLVIGHEITHGFDDEGSQFDANGDLENWWDSETRKKFLNKSECIVAQYSNYYVPEVDLNLNGIITQGENIADNGGLKDAYRAYVRWVENNGEEKKLPGLQYTPRQLFWISSAHLWCSKERKEYLKMSVLSKYHSPPRFRINGPMSNLKEFSDDWNCPLNSKMNPEKKCRIW